MAIDPSQILPYQSQDPTQDQSQQAPPPANNAQNAGPVKAGLRGVLAGMLKNFSYNGGQAMIHAAGGETDAERSIRLATTAHLNAQTQLAQSQAMMIPVQSPNGSTMYVPAGKMGDVVKQMFANQGKTDTAQINSKTKLQAGIDMLRGALAKQGLEPDQDENGAVIGVKPMDELSAVQQATADLQKAHTDVLMNPNNPTLKLKEKEVQSRLAMAQASLSLRQQGNQRADAQFQINNGVTPQGTPATIQGAGQAVDQSGSPIGRNFQGINTPTGATRTAAEQGGIILDAGNKLKADIDAHRDKLGNMEAIVNSAFLGTPLADPDSARIAASLASYAALNPRLHGFRGSQALAEFKKLVGGLPNNPDAMKAAIDGIASTAGTVQKAGTPRTNVNTPAAVQSRMPKSSGFNWGNAPVKK
jgi:hypothetical protein